jgi:RimJ/RimL family protein N-acetyltransferase
MLLEGRTCRVREWRGADAASLVLHANNINVARQLRDRFPHPYGRSDATAFLRHVGAAERPSMFAIEVDGDAVGGIGFVPGADVERFSAEIGYWLGEPFWGRGIVSEALVMVTGCAFDEWNLLRLFALPFADNAASVRVLEKAGYVREARLRASSVKYGEPRDQFLYARINDRWRGARDAAPHLG